MPIRTNRGRAAVYRRLWGWPMRSPRHLVAVVFVVAVLVTAVSIIVPQLAGSGDQQGGAAAETSTTAPGTPGEQTTQTPGVTGSAGGTPADLPTRIPSPTQTPTSAPPAPAALDVAESWAAAWVNHPAGTTNEQWLDNLRPFTTEEFLGEMASVEPANITATKVTGPPVAKESYTSSITVTVPTDAGALAITVIDTKTQGWRVAFYEPGQK